jgi:ribonuclease HI
MACPRQPFDAVMHIDGGARGNPGPAAAAVVVAAADGTPLDSFSRYLGETTNNVAEYRALLVALEYALEHHYLRLKVVSDSELLVRQMQGRYKVKSPDLKPLHERAGRLIERLATFAIEHVPRERNRGADRLVNEALDAAAGGDFPSGPPEPRVALRATATYRRGVLRLHQQLPLPDGEDVEVEIHRKK